MIARRIAEGHHDVCNECGAVDAALTRVAGQHLCPECADLAREEQARDARLMDCVDAMALMGASRTWA